MKLLLIFFLLNLWSCGYPDIDSMPDFKNLILTKDEGIDLCKLHNTDKQMLTDCINKLEAQE